MSIKIMKLGQYKVMAIGLAGAVLLCLYMVTDSLNKSIEMSALRARCSLAEQALAHPNKKSDKKVVTITRTKYVNLTEEEKQAICEQYDTRMDYLNRLVNSLQENVSLTQEISSEQTEAVIPEIPASITTAAAKTKSKLWGGPCIMQCDDTRKLGITVEKDMFKLFRLNATASPGYGSLAILMGF